VVVVADDHAPFPAQAGAWVLRLRKLDGQAHDSGIYPFFADQ
jgi:hypothetical protein